MLTLTIFIILFINLPQQHLMLKMHCKHANNIKESHIHYCCKHPDGHNVITEQCARKTNFDLPAANEEAIEDVTVEQVVKGMCWSNCVFEEYDFMHNGQLNMTAVRQHYKEVHKQDSEYEREMIAAFEHCHGKSEEAAENFLKSDVMKVLTSRTVNNNCDVKPSIVLSCVIHEFFHNCPKERWSNTKECNDTRAFAKKCRNALTTM